VDEGDYLDLTDGGWGPRRGDIIYSRNASIGIAAYVDTDRLSCMGQDVCLVTSEDQGRLYLSYVLNSRLRSSARRSAGSMWLRSLSYGYPHLIRTTSESLLRSSIERGGEWTGS